MKFQELQSDVERKARLLMASAIIYSQGETLFFADAVNSALTLEATVEQALKNIKENE